MKTIITLNKEIKRVSNDMASDLVHKGKAKYCPKEQWKKNVRDVK